MRIDWLGLLFKFWSLPPNLLLFQTLFTFYFFQTCLFIPVYAFIPYCYSLFFVPKLNFPTYSFIPTYLSILDLRVGVYKCVYIYMKVVTGLLINTLPLQKKYLRKKWTLLMIISLSLCFLLKYQISEKLERNSIWREISHPREIQIKKLKRHRREIQIPPKFKLKKNSNWEVEEIFQRNSNFKGIQIEKFQRNSNWENPEKFKLKWNPKEIQENWITVKIFLSKWNLLWILHASLDIKSSILNSLDSFMFYMPNIFKLMQWIQLITFNGRHAIFVNITQLLI